MGLTPTRDREHTQIRSPTQCYDRIVHAPAALCMIQHGAHELAVQSMFETLQKMDNRVITAYGLSTESYGGKKREEKGLPPCQGSGQGNGAGPARFGATSSTGISIQRKKGFGSIIRMCLSLIQLIMACFMFINDDQLNQTEKDNTQPGEEVVPEAQRGLDSWVGYLSCAGGTINPEKSYWYLVDYLWTGTQWRYRSAQEMPGEVTTPNLEGEIKPLQ